MPILLGLGYAHGHWLRLLGLPDAQRVARFLFIKTTSKSWWLCRTFWSQLQISCITDLTRKAAGVYCVWGQGLDLYIASPLWSPPPHLWWTVFFFCTARCVMISFCIICSAVCNTVSAWSANKLYYYDAIYTTAMQHYKKSVHYKIFKTNLTVAISPSHLHGLSFDLAIRHSNVSRKHDCKY